MVCPFQIYMQTMFYTYKVNEIDDNGAKAAVCNAMMLVHSLKSFVLYKEKDDYELALELIDDMGITRIEDSRR